MKTQMHALQKEIRRRNRQQTLKIFFGRGLIVKLSFVFLIAFVIVSVGASVVSPFDPNKQVLTEKLMKPGAEHLMGCDYLGRDVLSRIIYGGRVSLIVSFCSGALAAVLGITLGLIAGYVGGRVSDVILGGTNVLLSIPELVLTMVLAAIFGKNVLSMTIAIGIGMAPAYVRMMNGLVLTIRENDYIVESKLIGLKPRQILFRHLLPNTFPSLMVLFTINLGNAIMTESSLSYMGIGITPPTATWGNMVNDAYPYLMKAPWLTIFPGICIILLVIAFNVVGDSLRDALDPRLRGKL